jgi:hypothetical protein
MEYIYTSGTKFSNTQHEFIFTLNIWSAKMILFKYYEESFVE